MATRGGNSKKRQIKWAEQKEYRGFPNTFRTLSKHFQTPSEHFPNPIQTLSSRKKKSYRDDKNYTYQVEAVLAERLLQVKWIQ